MSKKFVLFATVLVVVMSCYQVGYCQGGGLRIQVGGYGGGASVNGYSNNFSRFTPYGQFDNYPGRYRYSYSNRYSPGYYDSYSAYGSGYGTYNYPPSYQSYYYAYPQPRRYYFSNGYSNGFTFRNSPALPYRYGTPRYYNPPIRRSTPRRFR